ncbi:hypothetical protein AAF712_014492 [Marasmius tenuissimus]|uniref:Uncharacterized protein n=1 Tax=Marasmius tenuissimus TaxID=585030 RepID=A0ABR2ZCV2_9AGAR
MVNALMRRIVRRKDQQARILEEMKTAQIPKTAVLKSDLIKTISVLKTALATFLGNQPSVYFETLYQQIEAWRSVQEPRPTPSPADAAVAHLNEISRGCHAVSQRS